MSFEQCTLWSSRHILSKTLAANTSGSFFLSGPFQSDFSGSPWRKLETESEHLRKSNPEQHRSKIEPKSLKSAKKRIKKSTLKKTCFSTTLFLDFSSLWPSKINPKSSCFRIFFENVDFAKILTKHWLCAQDSRFGFQKRRKQSPKHRFKVALEKSIAKNVPKIDFGLHFGLQNLSKIAAKSKKFAFESEL